MIPRPDASPGRYVRIGEREVALGSIDSGAIVRAGTLTPTGKFSRVKSPNVVINDIFLVGGRELA